MKCGTLLDAAKKMSRALWLESGDDRFDRAAWLIRAAMNYEDRLFLAHELVMFGPFNQNASQRRARRRELMMLHRISMRE